MRWLFAVTFWFLISCPSGPALAGPSEIENTLRSEVSEVQKLSRALTALCTHLQPELKELHSQVDRDGNIKFALLGPVWNRMEERELFVQNLRAEYARQLARANALHYLENKTKDAKAYQVAINHRILLLSQNLIPQEEEANETVRTQLASLSRLKEESWEAFITKKGLLIERADERADRLMALKYEIHWLEHFRANPHRHQDDVRVDLAATEGQLGLFRGQIVAEKLNLSNLRAKVAALEIEVGNNSPTTASALPPILPAICQRLR